MDPDMTLRVALGRIAACRQGGGAHLAHSAAEALRDLADWLEKGGFVPTVYQDENGYTVKEREAP